MDFPYALIDLTHRLDEQTRSWDGSCGFSQKVVHDYKDSPESVKFKVQQFHMAAGIGTHIDAPAHCIQGGAFVGQLPLSSLLVPCFVIDPLELCDENWSLTPSDIDRFERNHGPISAGSFVLVRTGWERFWGTEKYHNEYHFPSVTPHAAELLLTRGIVGLGIDTLSSDRPSDGFNVHQLLLGAGKYLVENVANASSMPVKGGFILVAPLFIQGATESPVRLLGLLAK